MQSHSFREFNNFEPVTSNTSRATSTTQQQNNESINQFQSIYYTNNNNNNNTNVDSQLEAQYYNLSPDLDPHQQQIQIQARYVPYQQQAENQTGRLSFTFDEIGAVINSKEFNDIFAGESEYAFSNKHQNNDLIEQNEQSSYEALRGTDATAVNEGPVNGDKLIVGTTITSTNGNTNNQTNNNNNNHSLERQYLSNNPFLMPTTFVNMDNSTKPFVEIIEQPSKCALRFRYKCEGRSAGSLPGVNASADNKTFPTIRINNYRGRAVVVISCVTKEAPYRAHPHNIVGKEGCKKGICTIVLNGAEQAAEQQEPTTNGEAHANGGAATNCMTRAFPSLGIQCVKRKDIEDSLTMRESIKVDPFRNGFQHKLDTSSIDLNVIRLCFQVFIEGTTPNKCDIPLMPVVSEPIHDKKAMSELVITKLSHCSAPATGGREVILLCDRISKDDVQVRFFEESHDGKLIWETYSDISPADVHKQVAICFRTPKYYNPNISQPVMARIQLKRVSDNQMSEPRMFQFLPCESDEDMLSRKRQKIDWVNNHYALDNILQ